MGIIAKYKFNQNIYENFIPEFNSEFTNYTITDEIDTDGYTIRTIESDSLPTLMRFGQVWVDGESGATDKSLSLLEVYECDTSNITSMNQMFRYCSNLTYVDSSNFDTSQVTSFHQTFASCTHLQFLDTSNWDTGKSTMFAEMFGFCRLLANINVSNWNVSQADSMYAMFNECQSLTSLDVSNFDTSNVTNMIQMFCNCYSLTSLDVSNFNTSQVTNMQYMFNGCSSLTSLDVSNFNTSQVTNMFAMFYNCNKLTSLDVSNFNTSKVTNMYQMFCNCSSLTSLDVSNFDTSQVTVMDFMFSTCSKLTSLDVSNFDTSKVTTMRYMFHNCSSLTSLDVSNLNTNKVTNMSNMFYNCSSLTSLDVSNFDTSQVNTMYNMFFGCTSLSSLDVSNFDTNKVSGSGMAGIFAHCSSLTSLDVSNFNTSKVTNITNMFYNCSSLTSLELSNFNTSEITDMSFMFNGCSSLTLLNLSSFNTSKVTTMSYMFYNCSSLISLDLSNFNTENVTDLVSMLTNCSLLTNIGAIYCDSSTINKISDLITTNTTIYHMDAKLEDLTKKSNITYKEYKMNILESDEEINLRRIGDIYDELNLETGELTQRIGEIVLDRNKDWYKDNTYNYFTFAKNSSIPEHKGQGKIISDKIPIIKDIYSDYGIKLGGNEVVQFKINGIEELEDFKSYLDENPITVQYELATPIIKTINLEGKPSIDWEGDTYLHLENNTLYPQLDCEIESINYYEIPKLKANTLYTLRYVGEPTQCIFGGLTYKTENNMVLTSGSSDNLLYFDKEVREVRKVVLIEGDVRDRNFDYFEGIENLGAVEIITHKSDMSIFSKVQLPPHIQLHRLPDGTCDELDIKTGILTRKIETIMIDGSETITKHNDRLFRVYKSTPSNQELIGNANGFTSWNYRFASNYNYDAPKSISYAASGSFFIQDTSKTVDDFINKLKRNHLTVFYELKTPITEKLIINYNNSCNYGVILPRGTSDNYNVITNEYKQNLDFIPINGSIAFDTATIKDTTVKFSVALSKFEVDTTNVRGSDGIYCDNDLFKYEVSDNDYEHAYIENDTTLHIYVNKNRLSSYDQVGFQLYLTSNPFNIYYAMRTPIISYVNYEDLNPEKASWEMLDCTEDGSITIESGNMDKTLLLDCMDYVAPTKNRFKIDLLKANTQYTVYAEGISGTVQLNFGGNIVNFTSGNIYTSGETQLVEFYTDNEIKNLIIIEGDTRNETIKFFEGVASSKNITVISSNSDESESNEISYDGITLRSLPNGVKDEINVLTGEYIQRIDKREYSEGDFEDENVLTDGAITLYELETQIIHQLDTQSLTPYQDGYISMEVETNYPSFIYSLPSTNAFYIPKIKNMTQYTLKYPVGKGIVTIGNIQYNVTSNSMLFTTPIEITGDKNSLIFETDDNPTEVIILEGNYSDREIKYFTGLNSVINPVIRVTNNLTGDSVEYKGNSDIALYSLPNKMSDKLDVLTGYLMRVTGIREYQDGDYELDNVFTDGVNTVYKLDSPLLYRNINFPVPTLNGYGTIELDSDEAIPQLNYRVLSNNYYPIELLEPNTTYTMIGEAQANTTFTLGGTYIGNYEGGKVVVKLGSITEKSLKFSDDIGLKNFMLVKGDATNSVLPFYTGIKSVEDISFLIKGYDGQENNLVLDDSIVLRECGGVYDSIDLINYTMTKRLNEIILVGTESWSVETSKTVDSNYQLFSLAVTSAKDTRSANIYCDKLTHKYLGNNTDCVYFENNKLYLCINKDTIVGDDVNALKVWLTKNNVKIIYPLINNVELNLDVVWEITPPTSYETQTEFSSNVALDSLKPILALTVATTTLEDVVSTLKVQNAKLEEENIATMLALTGIYETMVVPTINSGVSTVNLSDGKDGNNMNGMSISPIGMIYAKLIKKGLKTIEQVPAHLQAEVKYVLKEDK